MSRLLLMTSALPFLALPALAQDGPVRVGLLLGLTGPIESLAGDIARSAELAFAEAGASGRFLGGRGIEVVTGDTTCGDASAAVAAAERLVVSEGVAAILGAACSGASTAVAVNVAVPNGVAMVSPASTSPGLSTLDDAGLFFRTVPSDARQGEVLARVVQERGIRDVAVTYVNNDYGQGLADAFRQAFEGLGGTVSASIAHENGRPDYAAEVGSLAASGADHLLVIGYIDEGGLPLIRTALDLGAFERFILPDGMVDADVLRELGDAMEGSFGVVPGSDSPERATFDAMARAAGMEGDGPFRAEAYDAAALLILAMQASGTDDRSALAERILEVANAPGEPVGPGEIGRALELLAEGEEIDWQGASGVELSPEGDAAGTYREVVVQGDGFETLKVW